MTEQAPRRRWRRWLIALILLPPLLVLLGGVALYIPAVQDWARGHVETALSERLGLTTRIGTLRLVFPLDLSLREVALLRTPQDTLLSLGRLDFALSPRPLLDKQAVIPSLDLQRLYYHSTDSLGTSTRIRLEEAKLRGFALDSDRQRIIATSLAAKGLDVYYHSTDTTASQDTSRLEWQIALGDLNLGQSHVRVELPQDSVYVSTAFHSLGLHNVTADLGAKSYRALGAKLSRASLSYATDSKPARSPYLDHQHIEATDLNLSLRGLHSEGKRLSLEVLEGAARERSGLAITELRGKYHQDSLRMLISQLDLRTTHSSLSGEVDIPWRIFDGDSAALLVAKLSAGIDAHDVRCLAGGYIAESPTYRYINKSLATELQAPIHIELDALGTLADMEVERSYLRWPQVIELELQGRLEQLLDPLRRRGKMTLRSELGARAQSLLRLASPQLAQSYRLPPATTLDGDLDIRRNYYQLDAVLAEGNGSLDIDGFYDARAQLYSLDLGFEGLDISHFMPRGDLGALTGKLTASGRSLDVLGARTSTTLTGRIQSIGYRGMDLANITLDGSLEQGKLSLVANSFNKGLDFALALDGMLSRQQIKSSLRLSSMGIDLHTLGLSEQTLAASFDLEGELRSDLVDTHRLSAELSNVQLIIDEDSIRPEQVSLLLDTDRNHSLATLSSGDLKLRALLGEAPSQLMKRSEQLGHLTQALVQELKRPEPMTSRLENLYAALPQLDLDLELGKNNALRPYLAQERIALESLEGHLRLHPTSGLEGHFSARDIRRDTLRINCIDLELSTQRIARASTGHTQALDSMRLLGTLRIDKRRFRQQEGFALAAHIDASLQDARLSLEGLDERDQPQHRVSLSGGWSGDSYRLSIAEPTLLLGGHRLSVNPDNWLHLRKGDYFLGADLRLTTPDSARLSLSAQHEGKELQEARLSISGIELADYRSLGLPELSGRLVGEVNYQRAGGLEVQPVINGDIAIQRLHYEGKELGHFATAFFYEPKSDDSHYVTADMSLRGVQALSINGLYKPRDRENPLGGSLSLKGFPLEIANPFVSEYATYLGGAISGELALSGKPSSPGLTGTLSADKATVELRQYATTLRLDSLPLSLTGDELKLDNYKLYSSVDREHPLTLDGTIGISGKRLMQTDLRLTADEVTLLDQEHPHSESQLLYGRLIASTNMQLRGKLNALKVRGQLGIKNGTKATYVMHESTLDASDKAQGLVSFVDFADTVFVAAPAHEAELGGIDLNLGISIEPTVRFGVDLTADGRDYMRMQGGGNLQLRYLPYGEMNLRGRYDMSGGGQLQYTLPIVGSKLFTIDPSGYIAFDGNVYNPYVDFVATQKVRASTGEATGGKTNFLVSIKMKNRVENINLAFDLSAPENLNIQNSLATMSAEERGKQAIGLLATGTYLGGSAGGNNLNLNETFAALLQNQINTVAGNLLSGTDLSIGMEMNDGTTGNQHTSYTYSFSRRFYNDRIRLVIGGKLQTGQNVSNSEQTLVDNVALEYQLDKAGERFGRIYYKRVTDNVIEGEYNETGLGLMLRRKLNKLSEVFRFRRPRLIPQDTTKTQPIIRSFSLPLGNEQKGATP